VVALQLKTTPDAVSELLHLPWEVPLEEWSDHRFVRLPRGRHRHVVRFLEHHSRYLALKELPPPLAQREYRLLSFLKEEGLPVVELVGVAHDRRDRSGEPLESVLITNHLTYSLPYRHLFAGPSQDLHVRLVDALAVLLVRIHLAGFFWGDCSLSNALFRRDAGALVAYLVDTETGECHDAGLSDGQRRLDLDIATENIAGGLFDLEAAGRLPTSIDPAAVVDLLVERYGSLHGELTRADDVGQDELWRIQERLERLNELGFDTAEMELVRREGGHRIRFRPQVVEEGHHRRELIRLTGIEAQENQARRLLSAMRGYGAWLSREEGRELPEAVAAYRWLTERYEPTITAIPAELRGRLQDAEIYHQVLDHTWFLSERAGHDVGLPVALADYVATVLERQPDERTLLEVTGQVPVVPPPLTEPADGRP
jgi:hypothetical protein